MEDGAEELVQPRERQLRLRLDAGDAAADAVFRDEDVPAAFRGADHGIRWEVVRDGTPAYASGCAAVRLP